MNFGDLEPAHLHKFNVLRQAKYADNVKKLGIEAGTRLVM